MTYGGQSHWNRSGRLSGGYRKVVLPLPNMTLEERIAYVIGSEVERDPNVTLKACADKAMEATGATAEQVAKVLEQHFIKEET